MISLPTTTSSRKKRNFATQHINDAPHIPIDASNLARTPAVINCSLCTAAALVTNGTGQHKTSGGVAADLAGGPAPQTNSNFVRGGLKKARPKGMNITNPDQKKMGMGEVAKTDVDGINKQTIEGMMQYCQGKIGNAVLVCEDLDVNTAKSQMELYPEGTMFGVLIPGEGHWNYAEVGSNGETRQVKFFDYQVDHAQLGVTASVGSFPTLAATGMVFDNPKTKVVAFAVTPMKDGQQVLQPATRVAVDASSSSTSTSTNAAAAAASGTGQ